VYNINSNLGIICKMGGIMEKKVIVSKYIKNGLTESNGLILRAEMEKILQNLSKEDTIVLDFSDIVLFATPFFNSSIGYFILKLGPKKFDGIFRIEKISELGKDTYKHSYENAVDRFNKETDMDIVGKITKSSIENS